MLDRLYSPKDGDLKVWWIPQVPMKSFDVSVKSPAEAAMLLKVLADYDIFQFENNIKPDYCNTGGLCIFENGEWIDWEDPETGADIDEWANNA